MNGPVARVSRVGLPVTTCYLSALDWTCSSAGEAEDAWDAGKRFKMWKGGPCSIVDLPRISAAGWTHVCIVYQNALGQVRHWAFEIGERRGPEL